MTSNTNVTVPIQNTNVVVDTTYTGLLTTFQAILTGGAGAFLAALSNNPTAVETLTKGWPAWLALLAAGGLEYLKTKYLSGSNNATVNLVGQLANQIESSLIDSTRPVPKANEPIVQQGALS